MDMIPAIFATAAIVAFVAWAHLTARDALRRLTALRRNAFITNARGHRVRYTDASDAVRARVEQA